MMPISANFSPAPASCNWMCSARSTMKMSCNVLWRVGRRSLGFIFAPSLRRISAQQAQEIAARVPDHIERVGVFVDESSEIIRATVEQVGLTAVQLHGAETPEFVAGLFPSGRRGRRVGVIKTILTNHKNDKNDKNDKFEETLAPFRQNHGCVDSILIDSGSGSGKT